MKQTHFFLGANSAEGFYGLYDQLLDARLYDLIILKGTPGCGKSTFMRRAAAALEERGLESVYIHCSGDPDSLDGVISRHRHRYCGRHRAPRYGYLRTPVCLFILLRLLQLHERIA